MGDAGGELVAGDEGERGGAGRVPGVPLSEDQRLVTVLKAADAACIKEGGGHVDAPVEGEEGLRSTQMYSRSSKKEC